MRRAKRRLKRLFYSVVLVALGGGLALALHPLLPIEFKDSVEEWWDETLTQNSPPLRDFLPSPTPKIPQATPLPLKWPTPTSVSVPIFPPVADFDLPAQRRYLLGLVNDDRESLGLSPVVLGSNPAAQEHAEEMLEHSYLSHWGLDGLAPYMRYTIAGGVNYEGENVAGIAAPVEPGIDYAAIAIHQRLRETQKDWMASPGHRENILKPRHKTVNLGIACSLITCAVVQQFEGDYIEFNSLPTIDAGILTFEGNLSDGYQMSGVDVWYDPPPHPLTLGQLDRTYSYNIGTTPAAFLRPPPPPSSYYPETNDVHTWTQNTSPYDLPANLPRIDAGVLVPRTSHAAAADVNWLTTDTWDVNQGAFSVTANLTQIVNELGLGVYTVLIWGSNDGEEALLSEYSIFLLDEQ